jgi:hypothetical protein
MTLSILFSALLGTAVGYPLMKLELKSTRRERVRKILDFASQGLAMAAFVLPFFLFKFPAALLIVTLMTVASLRKALAAIILVGSAGYLLGGEDGLFAVFICPGVLIIPIAIIFSLIRNQTTSKQYTTLGIDENESASRKNKNKSEMKLAPKFSLRKSALYCSLILMLIESNFLNLSTIHLLYGMEKAMPRLAKIAEKGSYTALRVLNEYGKAAVPFEIELLSQSFQSDLVDKNSNDERPRLSVSEITGNILEMGEVESLRQLGDNQKKALRAAAANYYLSSANSIAIEELVKLKAIPELISLLNSNSTPTAIEALLQFRPDETIPLLMKWQENNKQLFYEPTKGSATNDDDYYYKEFAKYGAVAIPELISYLDDKNKKIRGLATGILLKMGAPVVPSLNKMLHSNNYLVVNHAAYILGMLGEKNVVPILIDKLKTEEDEDGLLAEALSNISDERATRFFIADYQGWKDSLEKGDNWEEFDSNKIYDESVARTKTALAQSFLEKLANQSSTLTYRKHLIQLLEIYFWKDTNKAKMGDWIAALENYSGQELKLAVQELREMGDPVVLPFLIQVDEREHKSGKLIQECEIHAAIAALSK